MNVVYFNILGGLAVVCFDLCVNILKSGEVLY